MSLVSMKELLKKADKSDYGIGAFSIANMEMIMGTVKAAEQLNFPIILQIAEVRLKHSPLNLIGPVMIEAAKNAKVPVAVHLDHGVSIETIKQALDLGFTSVMFDGSHLPLDENIEKTNKVLELAKKYDACVEAEIGRVGGSEDGSEDINMLITRVEDAERFYEETKVDALAVAIGNAHGVYKETPNLQFERLKEINNAVEIPLVLHGGSGIKPEEFKKCIKYGIKKINIATSTLNNVVTRVDELLENSHSVDYFTYHNKVIEAAYENVKNHINIFKSYK
ncbi:class II fructose-bisphosphate aldolase [Clostridium ganghwense]|uniref:Class II aldolase n=1 Tax=Clostridium ganghwense TaxID=312089 RepID=A0ABT4CK70_9CLOT|nr:class II fructose-bisphosphate aldolase [Clostridium ganghwense]MCY6369445.1 class II aldolase [Clostridium ganghwense]